MKPIKTTHDFAVVRGACFTTFSNSAAAAAYNKAVLGSMLVIKTTSGWKPFY